MTWWVEPCDVVGGALRCGGWSLVMWWVEPCDVVGGAMRHGGWSHVE